MSTTLLLDLDLKITVFGLTISSSWGNGHATPYRAILRALHRQGHRVTFFEKDAEYYYWRRDFTSCDYCDLVLYADWNSIHSRALNEAAESDVVIVGSYCPDGALISEEILALGGPLRVFYDLDTPITLANLDGGDLEYLRREQVGEFDLYLSFTGGVILAELESKYKARMARALYGCVDPDVHSRTAALGKFACDLSYMGTYAADRQAKVDELFTKPACESEEMRFILAGSLYPKHWNWPRNVRRFDHVTPADHAALYSSSRATLNITREGMARTGYCPSGRFFEAAACGTPILTDWFEGLEYFFKPGQEIYVVGSGTDVVSALRLPHEELSTTAGRGRERTLTEHTGEVRARQLLRYLEEAVAPMPRAAGQQVHASNIEVNS